MLCPLSVFLSLSVVFFLWLRTSMLHSNPGDYAWGQGGLDAVITEVSDVTTHNAQASWQHNESHKLFLSFSFVLFLRSTPLFFLMLSLSPSISLSLCPLFQLLGQFESTGPPPAEKEMISSLPTVSISREQTGVLPTETSYCMNTTNPILK